MCLKKQIREYYIDVTGQQAIISILKALKLMNEQGDTVVLKGVSYGWHQFWPRFYNASTVAYLSGDWGAEVLRASMGVDLDSACYVYKPEFGINCGCGY